MADVDQGTGEGQTAESCQGTTASVRRVPGNLLGFLTSRIADYLLGRVTIINISAEIHECPGQSVKLILYGAKGKKINRFYLTNYILAHLSQRLT